MIYKFYFGHHKCGSVSMRKLLELGFLESLVYSYKSKRRVELINIDEHELASLDQRIKDYKDGQVIAICNFTKKIHKHILGLGIDYKAFQVVRNPRDLLISCYHDHQLGRHSASGKNWFWPSLAKTQGQLAKLNLEDGISYEMENIFNTICQNQFFEEAKRDKNILTVKLEDLKKNWNKEVGKIESFIRPPKKMKGNCIHEHKSQSKIDVKWEDLSQKLQEKFTKQFKNKQQIYYN